MAKRSLRTAKSQSTLVSIKGGRSPRRLIARIFGLGMVFAGLAVAGWFGWQQYTDSQRADRLPIEVVEFWKEQTDRLFWNGEAYFTAKLIPRDKKGVLIASPIERLGEQLVELSRRWYRYEVHQTESRPEQEAILRDHLEGQFLQDGTFLSLVLILAQRPEKDPSKVMSRDDPFYQMIVQWNAGVARCRPLAPTALAQECVTYLWQRYRLDAAGVARLNADLRHELTGYQLVVGDGGIGGFLFGPTAPLGDDVWQVRAEYARAGSSFPMGWTNPVTGRIVVRDLTARRELFDALALTWIDRDYDLDGRPMPSELTTLAHRQQFQALKTLRELVLGEYQIPDAPADHVDRVYEHPNFPALWRDVTNFTVDHELGHRAMYRRVSAIANQFGRLDDGGLKGLSEALAELNIVRVLLLRHADPTTTAQANRQLHLLLLLLESRRFYGNEGLKRGRWSGGGYYDTMANVTSLLVLPCVRPDHTIDWGRLSAALPVVYDQLVGQLSTSLPQNVRKRSGQAELLDGRQAETIRVSLADQTERTYLEDVILRALSRQPLNPADPAAVGAAQLAMIEATRAFEVRVYQTIITTLGLRVPWGCELESFTDQDGVPIRVVPRHLLDRLRTERFTN